MLLRQFANHRSRLFQQLPISFAKPLEADTHPASSVAINDLSIHYDLLLADWNAEQQDRTFRKLCLRIQIETAGADVLCARHASGILAVEKYVHDETRTVKMPALIMRRVVGGNLFTHVWNPPVKGASTICIVLDLECAELPLFVHTYFATTSAK